MTSGMEVFAQPGTNRSSVRYPDARSVEFADDGSLVLTDESNRLVAVWAAGEWIRVEARK